MFRLNNNWLYLFSLLMLAGLLGCSKFLPEEFQERGYELLGLDRTAVDELKTPLVVYDTVVVQGDTVVNEKKVYVSIVTDTVGSALLDNWSSALDSGFISLDTLLLDTLLLVVNPTGADSSYSLVFVEEEDVYYFYVTWDVTEVNKDVYVDIGLRDSQGASVFVYDNIYDVGMMASATATYYTGSGGEVSAPMIRTKAGYKLREGGYLVRFFISEPAKLDTFRMVILGESKYQER